MYTRRPFIKKALMGTVALNFAPALLRAGAPGSHPRNDKNQDVIRIALIGKGKMGTSDTRTALMTGGVELIGVCDLYDARLQDARKLWGDKILVTKDYKDILSMSNVDAVIVATPDHWHQQIAIDSLKAGKHVYCEKPVIHKLEEGKALLEAQEKSNCLLQVGSQGMASLGNRAARKLVQAGAIGRVNFVEAQFSSTPRALSQFVPPDDASEQTIWWSRFLGNAPKREFDPRRFFQWRSWSDYGTGLAGDLFVHVVASIQYIMNASGPEKVYATGGIRHYIDGSRDTPDFILGYFDYPDKNNMGAFTLSVGANCVDGVSKKWGSTDFRIVGDKGTLEVGWDKIVLKTLNTTDENSFGLLKELGQGIEIPQKISSNEFIFQTDKTYKGGHYDHFSHFFEGIRNGAPISADALFAVRSAAPALLCNLSYLKQKPVFWDAEKLIYK
ncbi:MAG: Gfo/Idh/MocA family oxidoreductase [Prolixibacteraceae bacterium]|jgi:predicted dehydrogenase|nr:Gfo/Idh/MocA family oxidoreductase [Prolixibacteraceae bacterium]